MLWLIRLIPLISLFAYASIQDYRHGEVPNKVWLYTPVGAALLILELFLNPHLAVYAVTAAAFTAMFALGIYFFRQGKGFGAADAKALIMLSLCYPLTMNMLVLPLLTLAFAGLYVGLKFILSRGKGGLFGQVRLVPYLFAGLVSVLALSLFLA